MKEKLPFSFNYLKEYLVAGQFDKVLELFQQLAAGYELQQARFEALLDTVSEAVCMIDEQDQVVVWNRQAELLYGINKQEITGKALELFFSNLMVSKVMKERRTVTEEYHAPCPDKHVLINAQPIHLDQIVVGGVCCERDITEVVQLNQKLSKSHEEVQTLKQEIKKIYLKKDAFSSIYGHSSAISEAIAVARRVATASVPILLRGESGTGKELFARAIHETSLLKGPFIAINCGAIPANLFESELFGYQPGAFTGADRKGKAGLLEQANGGTLLLDELGDMPKEMQVKLLRTLQDKAFYRVGGQKPIKIEVRLIAATNRNLEEMIKTGEFRQDLYYRLNVVSVILPPLRERKEDIPELVQRGLVYYSAFHNKQIHRIDPALLAILLQYSWPGNIRELFNVLERLVILADNDVLNAEHLPENIGAHGAEFWKPEDNYADAVAGSDLTQATLKLEREAIAKVLAEEHHNKANAAKRLGIPRSTLYYKLRKLGIECQ